MEAKVVESKFDRFAADFYRFLSVRYDLKLDYRIKIVEGTWEPIIPPKLIPANKPEYPVITFDWSNADSAEEQTQTLTRLGFSTDRARLYSQYDALVFIDFKRPIRMQNGDPYLWNLIIAHHVLHIVELLTKQQIINEPPHQHEYEEHDALEHLHRFIAWIGGVDETIQRYIPRK